MGQIFQSNQLFLMSDRDMEKAFRSKPVYVVLKDCNVIRGIITGFELSANEPHSIIGIIIDKAAHGISINKISNIELL